MQNVRQLVVSERPDDSMDMVGHDGPCDQFIMATMKMRECIPNRLGDSLILQITGASPAVQNRVDLLGAKTLQFRRSDSVSSRSCSRARCSIPSRSRFHASTTAGGKESARRKVTA